MAQWYFSRGDRAQGPVDDSVILEQLKLGQLTLVDLVYKEGDSGWQTINEIPEFRAVIAKDPLPPSPTPEIEPAGPFRFSVGADLTWVLLQKVREPSGNERYSQSGPYSAQQLEEMIASKKCHYADYVWRPGYRRWARLGNLPEFDRRRKTRDNDPTPDLVPLPEIEIDMPMESRELLSNVVTPVAKPKIEVNPVVEVPEDAEGRDLTDITASQFELPKYDMPAEAPVEPSYRPPVIETNVPSPTSFSSSFPPPREEIFSSRSELVPPPLEDNTVPLIPPAVVAAPPPVVSLERPAVALPKYEEEEDEIDDNEKTVVQMARPKRSPEEATQITTADQTARFSDDDDDDDLRTVVAARIPDELQLEELPKEPRKWQKPMMAAFGAVAVVLVGLFVIQGQNETIQGILGSGETEPAVEAPSKSTKAAKQDEPSVPVAQAPEPQVPTQAPQANVASTEAQQAAQKLAQNPTLEPQPQAIESPPAQAPAAQEAPVAAAPAKKPEPAAPAEAAPANPIAGQPGIKRIEPGRSKITLLEIVPVKVDSARPIIALNTDAPIGTQIYLSVSARSGELLKLPSYYRTATQMRGVNPTPFFDVTSWNLPPGQYRVEVASGELRRSQNVFIGKKDPKYGSDLEKHLKSISFQQQEEKKALFNSARELERLAKALGDSYFKMKTDVRSWRGFYSDWQKQVKQARGSYLDRISIERRNDLAYPDELITLKSAAEKLIDQADTLNDSIMSGSPARDVASGTTLSIVKEFNRLKSQAAQISSRR